MPGLGLREQFTIRRLLHRARLTENDPKGPGTVMASAQLGRLVCPLPGHPAAQLCRPGDLVRLAALPPVAVDNSRRCMDNPPDRNRGSPKGIGSPKGNNSRRDRSSSRRANPRLPAQQAPSIAFDRISSRLPHCREIRRALFEKRAYTLGKFLGCGASGKAFSLVLQLRVQ
jgi:hypothetical protein